MRGHCSFSQVSLLWLLREKGGERMQWFCEMFDLTLLFWCTIFPTIFIHHRFLKRVCHFTSRNLRGTPLVHELCIVQLIARFNLQWSPHGWFDSCSLEIV